MGARVATRLGFGDTMIAQASQLQAMMKPYQSAQHTVVAFHVKCGKRDIIGSGPNETGAPCEDLIFEIGSITKVFTAILLCVQVEDGKIDPDAPISEMSDTLTDVPHWITPARLASHTSGLPNFYVPLWKALLQQQPIGPYANFTRADLLDWLQKWRGKKPASNLRHRYSNLGFGLLGEAMAMQEGKQFSNLLAQKVIRPLGLSNTTGHLRDDQRPRFMQPRYTNGNAAEPWSFDALAGAGFLRSTPRDLARFSGAVIRALTAPETPLDRALERSTQPIFSLGHSGGTQPMVQCSGWISANGDGATPGMLFANGGTAGSTCALYISAEDEGAIGIMSNNGIAASLWASAKLGRSSPLRRAQDILSGS